MKTSLFNVDLRKLPEFLFFLILVFYPLFSILVYKGVDINPNYIFGFLCFTLLLLRFLVILKMGRNLVIPYYLFFFGLFAVYTIVSDILFTNKLEVLGILKYIYSNFILLSFVVLLVIENTHFPTKWINIAIKILSITLVIAAIVSLIQISNPLFLSSNNFLIEGLSYDRFADYYANNSGLTDPSGSLDRLFMGYRFSIYGYVKGTSVGMDNLAILSLLIGLHSPRWITKLTWIIAAASVSFLSSGRWIIVNFFVVASQIIWTSKNKLANLIYFVLSSILLLMTFGLIANFMGFDVGQYISERLLSDTASTRLLAFEVFFKVFPDNPIFGTGGVDTEEMARLLGGRSSQIHVGFLKLFYYYGLVGGFLYLSFTVAFLIRLRKIAKYSGYWGGFFAILAFFIANLTLVELNLFYFGPLLAIIFANHFYFNKMENKASLILNGKLDNLSLN